LQNFDGSFEIEKGYNRNSQSGVNFINVIQADFAQVEPESAKKNDGLTVFLSFWDLRAKNLLAER